MSNPTLDEWLEAAVAAVDELCTTALGFDRSQLLKTTRECHMDVSGSYIAMVGDDSVLQIGLASDPQGCQVLARALLGMEEDEENLPEADMSDALGEIANILAGGLKTRMVERDATMRLGLPMVVHGRVDFAERMETAVAEVQMGPVLAHLMVMRESHNGQ